MQTENPAIKDSVIEKIAQTYLSDTKEDDFSFQYKRLKRNLTILAFLILAILIAGMGIFIFSSQRINVAITVSPLEEIEQDSARREVLENYQFRINLLNPKISRASFGASSSPACRLGNDEVFIFMKPHSGRAMFLLNFRRPVDFSNGVLFFKTNALNSAGCLRLVLRDINYQSNSREGEVMIVENGKHDKDVLLRPKAGSSGIDLSKISQLRFELQPALKPEVGQTAIYIKELTFLAQKSNVGAY